MERMTGLSLVSRDRNLVAPFLLSVQKSGGSWIDIQFLRVFRLLPKKRLVALASDKGRLVLVKLFFGKNARRNSTREHLGVTHIQNTGVATPKLLWEGVISDGGVLLVFEFLPDAASLDMELQKFQVGRDRLVGKIMEVMAQLHDNGVVQRDIHLENFLLSEGACYTIDGAGIRKQSQQSLPERLSLRNLSLFFAQFSAELDDFVPPALTQYENARNWQHDKRRLNQLMIEIQRSREARKRSFLRKTVRDCTRFVSSSTFTRFMVCERKNFNYEMRQVIQDPDRFVDSGFILKSGNTATVSLVKLSDRSVVIKRYNVKGFFHGLKLAFRVSRARISWKNAFRLEFLGIPALKALALIENRLGFFGSKAYLIAEYIEGPTAWEFLRASHLTDNTSVEITALKDILTKLSESRICHGDLKATNFLMSQHKPLLIDLDSMREFTTRKGFSYAFRQDLERFMENWRDQPAIKRGLRRLLSDLINEFGVIVN